MIDMPIDCIVPNSVGTNELKCERYQQVNGGAGGNELKEPWRGNNHKFYQRNKKIALREARE